LGDKEVYLITNVYGPQKPEDKLRLLTLLKELRERHLGIPSIMGGDFNMIRSISEKKDGTRSLGRDSIAFQNFINNMRLVDTETSNGIFTWNNKRGGESQVASKLDRFIILEDLILIGLDLLAMILPFGGLDHWPIQIEASFIGTLRNRPFRFENIWLTHPDFISNIEKWWIEDMQVQGTKMFLLLQRLKHIKLRLKDWKKNEFGNIFEAKKVVERKLQEINQILITDGFNEERKEQADYHQQEWEGLCKQEEIFWKHKSRVRWLKEGERNIRFFHKSTMDHQSHNRISKIKDSQGNQLNTHKEIEAALVQHFQGIVEEPLIDRSQFINKFTKHFPKLVTREDNYSLNKPVNEEEVSEVIKEMQNGKAPGPNGFNVDFFKACWDIVKHDILDVVEDSRKNKTILKALNTSFISLIPKPDNAITPNRFIPIALCNVVYKIISKIIANRLKPLLPTLVYDEQTGYVEGRKILNNIIQAHEVVQSLKSNR